MKILKFNNLKQLKKAEKMLEWLLDYGSYAGGFNINYKKLQLEKIWWEKKK